VDGSYRLAVEDQPDPLELALLEERLAAAAIAAAGVGEEREFGIFVRDDEGQVVAGASGSTWGGCCQVHAVWVDDPLRGRGLARALMAETEAEARRRGCRLVMGLTYQVLTADFYDRLGYRTVGVIDDCPAGTSTRWYCKDL
jgi:GNAT superfamily N-acetyltransferase